MDAKRRMRRIGIGLTSVIAFAVLTGTVTERVMRQRAKRAFPAEGRLVEVAAGRRLQLECRGAGSPTVVLEGGLDVYGSLTWAAVHDSIAATTRTCGYSRAGILWSDRVNRPLDLAGRTRDLHAALRLSGESPPWIMVAIHSAGRW
jgi:hypothetical protein